MIRQMRTSSFWMDVASKFGVPAAILAAVLWATFHGLLWLGTNVLKPQTDEIVTASRLNRECLERITGAMNRHFDDDRKVQGDILVKLESIDTKLSKDQSKAN